jgi:sugar lactone lactonase YvrE
MRTTDDQPRQGEAASGVNLRLTGLVGQPSPGRKAAAMSAIQEQTAGVGKVLLAAAEMRAIVGPEPRIEKLADGFAFTEGPIWRRQGDLLFSDIPNSKIMRWAAGQPAETFRHPSGKSNGLTLDHQGRLVACEHETRRVTRTEADGTVTVIAEHCDGKRLNSPNDVVVKSDGSIYFTDPPYGIKPEQQELDFQGVYRLAADGTLTCLTRDFERPNGLAFSPDETLLYIADSSARKHVRVYEVRGDGALGEGRLFAEPRAEAQGAPDGMKVDVAGRLYTTGPGGVWVYAPSGEHLGTILPPEGPANCAFGDADGQTLFMTARTGLYSIRLEVEGIRPR